LSKGDIREAAAEPELVLSPTLPVPILAFSAFSAPVCSSSSSSSSSSGMGMTFFFAGFPLPFFASFFGAFCPELSISSTSLEDPNLAAPPRDLFSGAIEPALLGFDAVDVGISSDEVTTRTPCDATFVRRGRGMTREFSE
jgi:hypothetical protein